VENTEYQENRMTEGKPHKLFDKEFIGLIKLARQLNENVNCLTDLYFHPKKSGNEIVVKTIDLCSINPLCKANNEPQGNKWRERWVEAYLIREAKNNCWELELAGRKYRFLASQFTFQRQPDSKKTKHVDLLLYDEQNKNLIALELKVDSRGFKKAMSEAMEELVGYKEELIRLFIGDEDEKDGALEAYNLELVKDVVGYIVYPRTGNESLIKEDDFPTYEPFGIMEYVQPWEKSFDEVTSKGKSMEINFTLRKPIGKTIEACH